MALTITFIPGYTWTDETITPAKLNLTANPTINLEGTISSAAIANNSISAAHLQSDSVTTVKILDANVTTAKIADANVTKGKLAADAVDNVSVAFALTGDISPTSIGANQNDYNPTSLSTASTLRLTSGAAYNITGLAGGADGRLIIIHNIGSFNLTLVDESASSSGPNRFALTEDLVLTPDRSCVLQYDSTSSRWRLFGMAPKQETYALRAMAVFKGTDANPITVLRGFNISGTVTKNGTGDYSIAFTTAMDTVNYAVHISVGQGGAGNPSAQGFIWDPINNQLVGSVRIRTGSASSGALADYDRVYVSIFH